jgi:ribosomal protein L10
MKAGIAVDDWKLPVFRKRLTAAGFEYEDAGAFTGNTTLLTVKTDNMFTLKKVLEECQAECRDMKKGSK